MNVIPIPPSYTEHETLCIPDTKKYLEYLESYQCPVVMTTAGTSQFNLLTEDEIAQLNQCVCSYKYKSILGIPPVSQKAAIRFVKDHPLPENCYYMALYPDRFYSDETIINYFKEIRQYLDRPMYVHGMFTRSGYGGVWDYTSDVLNKLFEDGIIFGIKEEHSALTASYNVLSLCHPNLDIIVAGGSMRRHQFLRSAGANAFLAGIGNLFPEIEKNYFNPDFTDASISLETKLFRVFNKHGWHRSLRIGLSILGLGCNYDRMPYPERKKEIVTEIKNILQEIQDA